MSGRYPATLSRAAAISKDIYAFGTASAVLEPVKPYQHGKVGEYPPSYAHLPKGTVPAGGYIIHTIQKSTPWNGMPQSAASYAYSVDNYGSVFCSTNGEPVVLHIKGQATPLTNSCIDAVKLILQPQFPHNVLNFHPLLSVYKELDTAQTVLQRTEAKLKATEADGKGLRRELEFVRTMLQTSAQELAGARADGEGLRRELELIRPMLQARTEELAEARSKISDATDSAIPLIQVKHNEDIERLLRQLKASDAENARLRMCEEELNRLKEIEEGQRRMVAFEQRMLERQRMEAWKHSGTAAATTDVASATTSVASATTDVVASANTTEIDRELYDPE